MTVLVTGASGHVGANLVRRLLDEGRTVRVLIHRSEVGLEGLDVERARGDLLDPDSLREACRDVDEVHHLAGFIAIESGMNETVQRVNVEGTANVARACEEAGVRRLVHVSSIHALAPETAGRPITEANPLAGDDALPYDRAKAGAEREVLAAAERGLDAVIVNPVAIVGPHDYHPSPMGEVLMKLYHRQLPALVEAGFNWIDVRDVVEGMLAASAHGRAGARYILTGEYARFRELSRLVAEATGARTPQRAVPMWMARGAAPFAVVWSRLTGGRPLFTPESLEVLRRHQDVDGSRAREELGLEPRPLRATLADTMAWFDAQGWLDPSLEGRAA